MKLRLSILYIDYVNKAQLALLSTAAEACSRGCVSISWQNYVGEHLFDLSKLIMWKAMRLYTVY